VLRISQNGLTTLAAALSYYFFFALFPFVLFLLALITLLPGVEGLQNWLLQWTAQVVPPQVYDTLAGVINGLLSQPRGGIVSLGAVSRCGAPPARSRV
jgi:membrane protein